MNMPIHQTVFANAVAMPRTRGEHVFDLHPALHIGVFAGFFAYLGIMWAAFGEKGLAIPFVIFGVFLTAAFIVPGWWARVAPGEGRAPSFADFVAQGLPTGSGHLGAGGATVQVMIMPAMLMIWGLIVAVIRFTV
ncbi:hypothetical protein [Sphingomonas sp.]|jgi:hypothetical protein|uniref:hypothetical protein n=1 Tax=Sphingomonas sp. TaxID=28214 RepID=UPI002E10D81F|nr:hypothetical protein [Sphingomonas sp.]